MKRQLTLLLMTLALCLPLSACGGAPKQYTLELDEPIPSLNYVLGGKDWELLAQSTDGEDQATPLERYTYTLPSGQEAALAYTSRLTEAEQFYVAGEDGRTTEFPDFTAEEGTVTLLRANLANRKLARLDLQWTLEGCVVTLSQPDASSWSSDPPAGAALPAPQAQKPEPTAAPKESVQPMSASEAIGFLKALPPSVLGLEGESMAEYNIYLADGEGRVDGKPCMRLRVYRVDTQAGSNAFVGGYLLTGDQAGLYRLDMETRIATQLELP